MEREGGERAREKEGRERGRAIERERGRATEREDGEIERERMERGRGERVR